MMWILVCLIFHLFINSSTKWFCFSNRSNLLSIGDNVDTNLYLIIYLLSTTFRSYYFETCFESMILFDCIFIEIKVVRNFRRTFGKTSIRYFFGWKFCWRFAKGVYDLWIMNMSLWLIQLIIIINIIIRCKSIYYPLNVIYYVLWERSKVYNYHCGEPRSELMTDAISIMNRINSMKIIIFSLWTNLCLADSLEIYRSHQCPDNWSIALAIFLERI